MKENLPVFCILLSAAALTVVVGQTPDVRQCGAAHAVLNTTMSSHVQNLSVVTAMQMAGISNATMCMKALADQLVWLESSTPADVAGKLCNSSSNAIELLKDASDACNQSTSALTGVRAKLENCSCSVGGVHQNVSSTSQAAEQISCLLLSGAVFDLTVMHAQLKASGCSESSMAEAGSHLTILKDNAALVNPPIRSLVISAHKLSKLEVGLTRQVTSREGDSFLLVCNLLYPLCSADNQPLAACTSTCHLATSTARAVGLFVKQTEPLFVLLKEAAKGCDKATGGTPCVSPVGNSSYTLISNSSSSATRAVGGFCFRSECKYPLLATTNSKHWDSSVQAALRIIHGAVSGAYETATLPFNGSILPCGRECTSVGFSENAQRISRILMSVFSTIACLMVVFAITVFYFNRKKLGNIYLRRMLLVFNICGGLSASVFIPAAYDDLDDLLCYPDGTLLTHEPGANSRCGFASWFTYFFVLVAVGLFCVLSLAWYRLLLIIDKPGLVRSATSLDTFWSKYRMDFISVFVITVPALTMSLVVAGLQGFDGAPLYGICTLSLERGFFVNYYIWYYVIGLGIAGIFFIFGIRQLLVQRHGVRGALVWIKGRGRTLSANSRRAGPRKFSSMAKHDERLEREFNQLAWQILIYILVAAFNVIFTVIHGIYSDVKQSGWTAETKRHIECTLVSCQPDLCPPLASLPTPIFVLSLLVSFISVFVLASWSLSHQFLANVPYLRLVVFYCVGKADASTTDGSGNDTRRFKPVSGGRMGSAASTLPSHTSNALSKNFAAQASDLSGLTVPPMGLVRDGSDVPLAQSTASLSNTSQQNSRSSSNRSSPADEDQRQSEKLVQQSAV